MRQTLGFLLLGVLPLSGGRGATPDQLLRHGAYTVRVAKGEIGGKAGLVEIYRSGKRLLTIRDRIICEAEIQPLSSPCAADLLLKTLSGGAHCCVTVYVFALGPRLRTLLVFDARNYDKTEIRDLDRDGRQELVAWDDSFAYFATSFAASPGLPFVFRYERGRYRDATAHFRWFIHSDQARAERELLEQIHRKPTARSGEEAADRWQETVRGATINIYGDALLMRRPARARRWLRQRLPESAWKWFLSVRRQMELVVAARHRKVSYILRGCTISTKPAPHCVGREHVSCPNHSSYRVARDGTCARLPEAAA